MSTTKSSSLQTTTAILLNDADNVYCVLRSHQAGDTPVLADVNGNSISSVLLLENIPLGHKVARVDIAQHEAVLKYGAVIGYATQAIPAGAHVHLHNLIGSQERNLAS